MRNKQHTSPSKDMKKYTLYVEGFNFGSFDNLFEAITAGGSQRVYFDIIDNITNNNAIIDWEEYHVWKKGN